MANMYSVRVELRPAGDYDELHMAMWAMGYRRFVTWVENGVTKMYQLPTGSYVKYSDLTVGQIREEARGIALRFCTSPWIWAVHVMGGAEGWSSWLANITEDPDAPKKS